MSWCLESHELTLLPLLRETSTLSAFLHHLGTRGVSSAPLSKWLETAQWCKNYQENPQTSFAFPRKTYKKHLQIKTTALSELFTCGFVPFVIYNAVLLVGIGVSCVSPEGAKG